MFIGLLGLVMALFLSLLDWWLVVLKTFSELFWWSCECGRVEMDVWNLFLLPGLRVYLLNGVGWLLGNYSLIRCFRGVVLMDVEFFRCCLNGLVFGCRAFCVIGGCYGNIFKLFISNFLKSDCWIKNTLYIQIMKSIGTSPLILEPSLCKAGRADVSLSHCIRKTIKPITTFIV